MSYMHSEPQPQPLPAALRTRLWTAIAATAVVLGLNVLLATLS